VNFALQYLGKWYFLRFESLKGSRCRCFHLLCQGEPFCCLDRDTTLISALTDLRGLLFYEPTNSSWWVKMKKHLSKRYFTSSLLPLISHKCKLLSAVRETIRPWPGRKSSLLTSWSSSCSPENSTPDFP